LRMELDSLFLGHDEEHANMCSPNEVSILQV